MLEILGSLVTGVLSGGATGLLGVLLQRYFDLQHKKQDIEIVKLNLANSIELAKMETERTKIRSESDKYMADLHSQEVEAELDSKNLTTALESDKATYLAPDAQTRPGGIGATVTLLMGLVDFLRGIVRPAMTVYLCVLVSYMFIWSKDLASAHGVDLSPAQITEIIVQITTTILYVFTVCTLFWYGTRPSKQQ